MKFLTPTPSPSPASRPPKKSSAQIKKDVAARGGLGGASTKPQVWLPGEKVTRLVPGANFGPSFGGVDLNPMQPQKKTSKIVGRGAVDKDAAISLIYDPEKATKILEQLQKRGIEITSFDDLEKIWTKAVDRASRVYSSTGIKKSPYDMLDLVAPARDKAKAYPWKGKTYNEVHTTRHIDEIGPETARSVITNSLKELLGRDPTKEEVEDFASRANAIVGAHPQITTSTTQNVWDPNRDGPGEGGYVQGNTSSSSHGGVTNEMLTGAADEQAKSGKEYGAYQAATTVSNWLFNAVNSPVG